MSRLNRFFKRYNTTLFVQQPATKLQLSLLSAARISILSDFFYF